MPQSLFRLRPEPQRRTSLPTLAVAVAVAAGLAAGCGSAGNAQSAPEPRDAVYLSVVPNRVEALQLSVDDRGGVTGTLNVDEILPSDPGHRRGHTTQLTGTETGNHVSLQPSGSSEHWSGDETGRALTIQSHRGDGSRVTMTFVRSDFAAYDRARQALSAQASEAAGVTTGASPADVRAAQQAYAAALRAEKQAAGLSRAAAAQASAALAAQNRVKAAAAQASAALAAQNRVKAAAARASAANAAAHRAAQGGK